MEKRTCSLVILSPSVSIGVSSAIFSTILRGLKSSSSVLHEHYFHHKVQDWGNTLGHRFSWVLRKRLLEHKEVHLVLVKQDHLLLLVGVHVVQLLTVLLRDHLEASWLHVVHPDIDKDTH